MNYKIAEYFDTIQGEGVHTGAREFFIRLAGCNVGKYTLPPEESPLNQLKIMYPKHSICTDILGTSFLCDTDYHASETKTEKELIELSGDSQVIRLTGGEPLLWDLKPLVEYAWQAGKQVRVETSGTLPICEVFDWVTCSPKDGFNKKNLSAISEWKFVVDRSNGDPKVVAYKIKNFLIGAQNKRVFIQAINGVTEVDKENVDYAFEVVKASQEIGWKVSVQIHKLLGYR